jgi:carboxymethylenebutenolidase
MRTTDRYEGLLAETTSVPGHQGEWIHAYVARPTGPGLFPGVVLFHHRPGWDEWYRHATRLFAHHGFVAICPDLYCRVGHGEPDDIAARAQAEGGVSDDQVVGDATGCVEWLRSQPISSGKVGFFGTCSGARHAYLAACSGPIVDAVVDCWGGRIVTDELTDKQPVAPVDLTADLPCPVLGLFGNEDRNPLPEEVDFLERTLEEHGKQYDFHRYDGAGHGFFYHDRPAAYRAEQAVDGWAKVWSFLDRTLSPAPHR